MPSVPRLLLHGAALAVGAVAGALGSFVHSVRVAGLPLGLVCALGLAFVTFVACGLLTGSRSGAAAAVTGWLVQLLLLSAPRPEGDLVVSGNAVGYAWMVGGMVVGGLAVAWPYHPAWPHGASSAPPLSDR